MKFRILAETVEAQLGERMEGQPSGAAFRVPLPLLRVVFNRVYRSASGESPSAVSGNELCCSFFLWYLNRNCMEQGAMIEGLKDWAERHHHARQWLHDHGMAWTGVVQLLSLFGLDDDSAVQQKSQEEEAKAASPASYGKAPGPLYGPQPC